MSLKSGLAQPSIVVAPGVFDAWSALLANRVEGGKATGSTAAFRDRMLDIAELNALIGTPEMLELGKRYDS